MDVAAAICMLDLVLAPAGAEGGQAHRHTQAVVSSAGQNAALAVHGGFAGLGACVLAHLQVYSSMRPSSNVDTSEHMQLGIGNQTQATICGGCSSACRIAGAVAHA